MAARVILSVVLSFVIIVLVPFPFYAGFSALGWVAPPEEAEAASFVFGVLISKVGTAMAFVTLLYLGRGVFLRQWTAYAVIWWLMAAIHEVGQSVGPGYSWMEGLAGILSEAVYFPLAAVVTARVLCRSATDSE